MKSALRTNETLRQKTRFIYWVSCEAFDSFSDMFAAKLLRSGWHRRRKQLYLIPCPKDICGGAEEGTCQCVSQ